MTSLGYPLQWPAGWKRSHPSAIARSRYKTTSFARVREGVLRSVKLIGGRDAVISSNIPLRNDGLPYANTREPDDAGIAVYWTDRGTGQPRAMACDCWRTTTENLHAIELALEALRQITRTGASQIVARAFGGFAALPPPRSAWREVLGYQADEPVTEEKIRTTFRQLAKMRHPDQGGSDADFRALVAALEEGLVSLGIGRTR